MHVRCDHYVQEKGLPTKQSWDFFTFLELVTGWLVPSTGQKMPVQPDWYRPPLQKKEDPAC